MAPGWRTAAIALVGIAALASRLAVIAPQWGQPLDDPDNYLALSRSLAAGRGFCLDGRPTAYRPPLYPLLLSPLARLAGGSERALAAGVLALNLALGLATVALTAATARREGLAWALALVAALIVALDPVLVAQARLAMTETLAAFLVIASLHTISRNEDSRRGAIATGMALGLAALARPSLLAPAALVLAARVALRTDQPMRRRLQHAALVGAVIAAVLAPWALRNRLALGHAVWTTTHGGYTLALGNNPVYYDEVLRAPSERVWSGPGQRAWWRSMGQLTAAARGDEIAADRIVRDEAIRVIRSRPADFARSVVDRLARFWGLAPSSGVYGPRVRLATALWTAPLWLALLAGLMRRDLYAWPSVAAPAFLLGLTIVHAVYWTDLRMRAPIVPAIALVAAAAGNGIVRQRNLSNRV